MSHFDIECPDCSWHHGFNWRGLQATRIVVRCRCGAEFFVTVSRPVVIDVGTPIGNLTEAKHE
jgi:hypothetical protein